MEVYVHPKCRSLSELHGVTTDKIFHLKNCTLTFQEYLYTLTVAWSTLFNNQPPIVCCIVSILNAIMDSRLLRNFSKLFIGCHVKPIKLLGIIFSTSRELSFRRNIRRLPYKGGKN
jgi:hypothetical protein